MLHASKLAVSKGSKVIGFNLGKRGFLTDLSACKEEYEKSLEEIFQGENLRIEERSLIKSKINDLDILSMNDLVVSHRYSDIAINYDLYIDNRFAGNHSSNSLLFSTPTGSTAYGLNVGGAIIDPALEAIQIIPVAAFSYNTSMKPIIVSSKLESKMVINIKKDEEISIKSDGQEVLIYKAEKDEQIELTSTGLRDKAKYVHLDNWNFFEVLSEKLNWAK